jgi:ankyrin repeat protein
MNYKKHKKYKKYEGLNQQEINDALIDACANNDFNATKYLLTSKKLFYKADINYVNENGHSPATKAIRFEDLKIFKYLLSSSELKIHSDIHEQEDILFIIAITHHFDEVLRFLIIDMNIERTKYVHKFVTFYAGGYAEQLFLSRELKEDLNLELKNDIIEENEIIKV